jgi:hypothetical protein
MKITICGLMKFNDEMIAIQRELESVGHDIFMPIKVPTVDYWSADGSSRVEAKKGLNLVKKHMDKIKESDAILVCNYTKGDIENYIGANTFLEMGYAHYIDKKIFLLHPLPSQQYIIDELVSFDTIVIDGDLEKIK